jgi:hypothetical protein
MHLVKALTNACESLIAVLYLLCLSLPVVAENAALQLSYFLN